MLAVTLLPTAIADLFAQAAETGKLTKADRYGLMAALLNDTGDEELRSIDRLLRAVCQGRIQVSDDWCAIA